MSQLIVIVLIFVVGTPLLVWGLRREAKRRARAAALERLYRSPQYAQMVEDFERFTEAIGKALVPSMERFTQAIVDMTPALQELGRVLEQDVEEED